MIESELIKQEFIQYMNNCELDKANDLFKRTSRNIIEEMNKDELTSKLIGRMKR